MKPSMFIGSSVEGLALARAVQSELQYDIYVTLWNQSIFTPSRSTLDSLLDIAGSFDFGIFIFSPDDLVETRGVKTLTVRDNVLFECGLFFSGLGKESCFFMIPRGIENFHLPSDLWGITPLSYDVLACVNNVHAAVGPSCTTIRNHIASTLSTDNIRKSLNGKWNQKWRVTDSENYEEWNESIASVRHIGNKFNAVCEDGGHPFYLKGQVENRFITGTWGEAASDFYYFGSFQFLISPKGNKLVGKLLGFQDNNKIAVGDWMWERAVK